MKPLNYYTWGLSILLFFLLNNLASAQETKDDSFQGKQLNHAKDLLDAILYDSAIAVLTPILSDLEANQTIDSPLGLEIQLIYAIALEESKRGPAAMDLYLKVREKSLETAQWSTFAYSNIKLAKFYEDLRQLEECYNYLNTARYYIQQYKLDHLYPKWAIRMASWHRVYKKDSDSAFYYITEALNAASSQNIKGDLAMANLVMGLIKDAKTPDEGIQYYRESARLFSELGSYMNVYYIYYNIGELFLLKSDYDQALSYMDSVIVAGKLAEAKGVDTEFLFRPYKFKGEIFKEMGELDSAILYLTIGYELEKRNYYSKRDEEIIEVGAKYNDEKKARQIETQARQIDAARQRRNLLLVIIALVVISSLTLANYLIQLNRLNKENKKQADQLKNLDEAKSRFFANVSHELRTPLTLMLGPIHQLLKENKLTAKQVKLLEMADKNGHQLNQLVNEILDLRKLEAGKMKLETKPTQLAPFFRSAFSQFESLADRKSIYFSYETTLTDEQSGMIDQKKCRQVVNNLLSNAFKFTPEKGQVHALLQWENGQLQLQVKDSGPGIHPNDLPFLFDRYFQTNSSHKPAEGGTGIGLALCREYAELFGGMIKVESKVGEGSVFMLHFPLDLQRKTIEKGLIEKSGDASVLEIPANSNGQKNKVTILIAEDHPDLQDYIRLILEDHYNLLFADNGKIALEKLALNPSVQLILSDLMMPVMNGYQLLEQLKTNNSTRHIPVIMLTARADVQDKLKALRIGVDDYLTKPFDEEELQVRIENLLMNRTGRMFEEEEALEPTYSEVDQEWLSQFEAFVQTNIASDLISVSTLSETFAMSESTLLRQLKRLTGLTPGQYLKEVRLTEARNLLERGSYRSISEVATAVGYGDSTAFSRSFKKRFGKSPSAMAK